MKLPKTKLPPGFRFDREEANQRAEPGQQSAQANAEASAEPGGRLAQWHFASTNDSKAWASTSCPSPNVQLHAPCPNSGKT